MTTPGLTVEKLAVLARREYRLKLSYRTSAVLAAVSTVAGLFTYGFLGNASVVSATTETYGMTLTSFLVSGVAFSPIITNGLGLFYQHATPSQIEEVMLTPTDFREYVLFSSTFDILVSLASAALLFGASTFLFGISYSYSFPVLLSTVALGVLSSVGLGFIGLAFQLVYKQTYVLSWLVYSLGGILGNMLVPVQVLPGFLQSISYLTPQYYFFTGIRVGLGSTVAPGGTLLIYFAAYTIIILALGLAATDHALKVLSRRGTHRWA